MKEILVLAEHRKGELRDITLDLLARGRQMATEIGAALTAVLLGHNVGGFADTLSIYADRVLVVESELLQVFHSDSYQEILANLISQRDPVVTLIGHTAFGIDLAPALATAIDGSLATDCMELYTEGDSFIAIRPAYGGRVRAKVIFRSGNRIATVQSGNSAAPIPLQARGEIISIDSPLAREIAYKRFLKYIDASAGDVDITQSEIVVSVGRGIGDPRNLAVVEDLAGVLGGVVACSRPVVDKKWLPKARQVGISGKTVQPKLYLAIGISGAFQHVSAIKGAGMIVAINKDPNAPIFRMADYGIVGDLFSVVPALADKISRAKAGK